MSVAKSDDYWNFHCWKYFNDKVFKHTFTSEDMRGRKFFLDGGWSIVNGREEWVAVNENVFKFEKNGELFLVPEKFINLLPMNPDNDFVTEVYLKASDKTIYKFIGKVNSAKITGEATLSFKDLMQIWNYTEHENERTRIFLNLLSFASHWKPIHIGICSEPASGKSSSFTVAGYISNIVKRVAAPTKAKMETLLFFYNVLILDEMTSVGAQGIRALEPLLLTISDETPELEKHSMARTSSMNQMDLEKTSTIFTFNRVEDVKRFDSRKKFFSEVWQNLPALSRRYVFFKVEGKIVGKRSKMNKKEAGLVAEANWSKMVVCAKHFVEYTSHLDKYLHGWKHNVELLLNGTQQSSNTESIVDCLDAVSDSQDEFDDWCRFFNECVASYDDMLGTLHDYNSGLSSSVVTERSADFEEWVIDDEN